VRDEITMEHKGDVETLNRYLNDIRGNKRLMGVETILQAGYFWHTLPVVPKATRTDEVNKDFEKYEDILGKGKVFW
jgi:hypothetical protein